VLGAAVVSGGLAGCGGGDGGGGSLSGTVADRHTTAHGAMPAGVAPSTALSIVATRRLPAPVQLPGLAAVGGRVVAAGGLDAADASVASVVAVAPGAPRTIGALPHAVHDAGTAALGGRLLVFGGGTASGPSDEISALRPGGTARTVGRLPAPSSDLAAATIGGVAYVVGGYDGSTPQRGVLAFRPGRAPREVARLPHPLRYAAVAAVDGTLLVVGGTDGAHARREIVRVEPASGSATVVGMLPRPLAHAAAAALGGRVYLFGGRGDGAAGQRREIYAIDPRGGAVRHAGALPLALSDLAAATLGDRVWVVGGRDAAGRARDEAWALAPARSPSRRPAAGTAAGAGAVLRPGRIPPPLSPTNVYAADEAGMLARTARSARPLVYVPNSRSDTVDVISQRSGRIVGHFAVGREPQHVVPAWDLRTLWVTSDLGDSLTPIDPRNGSHGRRVAVRDPYNLYFTADGRRAVVVAEAHRQLDFRDPQTMRLRHRLDVPSCAGVDHMDFTADGRRALVSCEFAGRMLVVDLVRERVLRTIALRTGAMPQDVKLSPDGRVFYVADMASDGVWLIGARHWRVLRLQPTGRGAHGLYPSRDARELYVSNRDEGTVSVVSFRSRRPVRTWRIPHSSPDMGGVSADGRLLWLSGRYNAEVYAIDTRSGRLRHRIAVGDGPHGLSVWPQPGRYSIGHTGIMR
jgi:DNA-binding beta-propeller fold protein YncE